MSDIMPNGHLPSLDWTDADWAIFDTWLRGLLATNVVTVTFTKADETERVMKCTLDPALLPTPSPLKEGKDRRKISEKTFVVFDLEANAWRSFTKRSVKSIGFSI